MAMAVILILNSQGSTSGIPKVEPWRIIFIAMFGALIVGVAWEIFEVYFGVTSFSDGVVYVRDTASDLLMDLVGGFSGSLYARKMIDIKNI